ncbi:MAG: septum formation initiator family protein [Desulfuromusa sp.]|nr:septum formation initiator family protein [Desulfuromusa sp.]
MISARKPGVPGRKNLFTSCLLVVILLMFAYAVFGSRGVLRIFQAEEQKQELQQQLADLQQQQQKLRNQIERLQKDKTYWEQLARTKLGMVREGELIYHLPDSTVDDVEEKRQ